MLRRQLENLHSIHSRAAVQVKMAKVGTDFGGVEHGFGLDERASLQIQGLQCAATNGEQLAHRCISDSRASR